MIYRVSTKWTDSIAEAEGKQKKDEIICNAIQIGLGNPFHCHGRNRRSNGGGRSGTLAGWKGGMKEGCLLPCLVMLISLKPLIPVVFYNLVKFIAYFSNFHTLPEIVVPFVVPALSKFEDDRVEMAILLVTKFQWVISIFQSAHSRRLPHSHEK